MNHEDEYRSIAKEAREALVRLDDALEWLGEYRDHYEPDYVAKADTITRNAVRILNSLASGADLLADLCERMRREGDPPG